MVKRYFVNDDNMFKEDTKDKINKEGMLVPKEDIDKKETIVKENDSHGKTR